MPRRRRVTKWTILGHRREAAEVDGECDTSSTGTSGRKDVPSNDRSGSAIKVCGRQDSLVGSLRIVRLHCRIPAGSLTHLLELALSILRVYLPVKPITGGPS